MYKGKGNTQANPRRKAIPTAEQQARYIAESIMSRKAEARGYTVEEYGISNMPEMIELVARQLGVIR